MYNSNFGNDEFATVQPGIYYKSNFDEIMPDKYEILSLVIVRVYYM
jgi:hypothetical protein